MCGTFDFIKDKDTMQNIDYSIIIPHYNSPDLLMRCLASIPVKENIQVVVIHLNMPKMN